MGGMADFRNRSTAALNVKSAEAVEDGVATRGPIGPSGVSSMWLSELGGAACGVGRAAIGVTRGPISVGDGPGAGANGEAGVFAGKIGKRPNLRGIE